MTSFKAFLFLGCWGISHIDVSANENSTIWGIVSKSAVAESNWRSDACFGLAKVQNERKGEIETFLSIEEKDGGSAFVVRGLATPGNYFSFFFLDTSAVRGDSRIPTGKVTLRANELSVFTVPTFFSIDIRKHTDLKTLGNGEYIEIRGDGEWADYRVCLQPTLFDSKLRARWMWAVVGKTYTIQFVPANAKVLHIAKVTVTPEIILSGVIDSR
jgi:hypothetical protein